MTVKLTNFALSALLATQKRVPLAPSHQARVGKEGRGQALARLHCLHGKVCAHGIRDGIQIFSGFQTLLRQKLDLSPPIVLVSWWPHFIEMPPSRRTTGGVDGRLTGSGTRSEQTFRSC